ncbi:MAG: GNAT family N-acetyltransferase [Leucobacter sp.]
MQLSSQAGRIAFERTLPDASRIERLVGRELASYDELHAANELYERVFGYTDPELTLNPNLLCALAHNGGSLVGVFAPNDTLVGFAYGFPGRDRSGSEYHYSQSAVVATDYQGQGIGRVLKRLQRRVAQQTGYTRMRWAFDPILTRNGHFNFNTLGAVGVGFHGDYYCRPETDRVVVEWTIDNEADPHLAVRDAKAPPLQPTSWAASVQDGENVWIPLPATPEQSRALKLRPKLADTLHTVFAENMVLVDCRRIDDETTAYLAVPRIGAIAEPASETAAVHPQPEEK